MSEEWDVCVLRAILFLRETQFYRFEDELLFALPFLPHFSISLYPRLEGFSCETECPVYCLYIPFLRYLFLGTGTFSAFSICRSFNVFLCNEWLRDIFSVKEKDGDKDKHGKGKTKAKERGGNEKIHFLAS